MSSLPKTFFLDGRAEPERLEPWGITRVGDLTDLDIIGIPVWFACRPNSRALSVAQGKGLSEKQARISAVMEALESAVAEQTTQLISGIASIEEMKARHRSIVPLNHIQRCNLSLIDIGRSISWVKGRGLICGQPVYAPYELVGLDMRTHSAWDHRAFRMSTIGLGAGRSWHQAVLHAIYETLENDCTSLLELLGVNGGIQCAVECGDTKNRELRSGLAKVRAAGIEPRFFDLTGNIPLPTLGCFIQSPIPGGSRNRFSVSAGFACRPNAEDAALAALLEAVQSRLTSIAGSREDLRQETFADGFTPVPDHDGIGKKDITDLHSAPLLDSGADDAGTLEQVVKHVRENSAIDDIYVFTLSPPGFGFHVVRVLVPRLESVTDDGLVRLGTHTLERLLRKKPQ